MQITWPPELIAPLLDRAMDERLSVVKIHSHPGGYAAFSGTDDEGDSKLLPMIRGWIEADIPHGSVVMLPSGEMFGRLLRSNGTLEPMAMINVLADAIDRAALGTRVIRVPKNLWNPEVIRIVAQCDIVIGCMDTIDGRFLLNTLATYYTLPYLDIGVRLDAVRNGSDKGRIREVCGTVHYLQPGRSSLMSRGLFTMAEVAAAGLRRNDPAAYAQQVNDGYIACVAAHRPAVISVYMFAASLAVNELLAPLHPFREENNATYTSTTF